VGTIEPRKNVPGLLTAFSSLVASGMPDTLVLAGKAGWGRWEGERSLARDEMARRLVLTGYVTEAQKIALYRGARALVYPSLMEGFGLQVLEAMACGCPVITTTRSAPQEVGGDAVDLVEPGDPEALEKAIRRLVDDPRWGDELRRRGLQRVRSFGWDRTARETLQTYRLAA
jgi:glycosyltransferase involved in cell wall biosynthesis